MVTRKAKQSLLAGVIFAIMPILVIIKSTGILFGSGPDIAIAAYERLPFAVADNTDEDDFSLSEQQTKALEHIVNLQSQQFGPSPLHRIVEKSAGEVKPINPQTTPSLQVTVQMIMTSSAGNTVLIDGKPYKVGQNFDNTDWVIRNIDGEARSATLENSRTGKSTVFKVQSP